MIYNIALSIFSLIIGVLITWWVARLYYKMASVELKDEAVQLRNLNILMLRAMESAGLAKFNRDESGNLTGISFEPKLNIVVTTSASIAKAKVVSVAPQEDSTELR